MNAVTPVVVLRLVCAWCTRVLREGAAPTSHVMCPVCRERFEQEVA